MSFLIKKLGNLLSFFSEIFPSDGTETKTSQNTPEPTERGHIPQFQIPIILEDAEPTETDLAIQAINNGNAEKYCRKQETEQEFARRTDYAIKTILGTFQDSRKLERKNLGEITNRIYKNLESAERGKISDFVNYAYDSRVKGYMDCFEKSDAKRGYNKTFESYSKIVDDISKNVKLKGIINCSSINKETIGNIVKERIISEYHNLRENNGGRKVGVREDILEKYNLSSGTFYRWLKKSRN